MALPKGPWPMPPISVLVLKHPATPRPMPPTFARLDRAYTMSSGSVELVCTSQFTSTILCAGGGGLGSSAPASASAPAVDLARRGFASP